MNGGTFGEQVQAHLRVSGYSQQNLANTLGLHPGVLNRKLHGSGNAHLTQLEVGRIIKTLVQWHIITTRSEALHLLELAHLKHAALSAEEWQQPPLDQLEESHTQLALPAIANAPIPPTLQHNMPAPLTRLIGREWAVERLQRLLERDDARLVTLIGAGGTGKTRLALHVASEMATAFAQGAWLVLLTEVSDPALVPLRILRVLDQTSSSSLSPVQSLITYLRDKRLLLVLDNFEQVGRASSVVSELLAAAPGLKVLVTSRTVLHVYGEHEFSVPPLDIPDLNVTPNLEVLSQYAAIQLFLERVQAVVPDFDLSSANGISIAQICARLDGLPLALELAAARVKMLSPALLLERLLEARLPVLVGGARNLPRKQQTLRNTFEWSYNLLSPAEQQCFTRLGVFRGSWSLEAAEAMMQEQDCVGATLAVARPFMGARFSATAYTSTWDVLERLVDSSLLVRQTMADGQVRFTMLDTLREYALERLAAPGE